MTTPYRIALAGLVALSYFGYQSTPQGIEDADLKKMLTGLGYKPKENGGLFEVELQTEKLNIPMRVFLSRDKQRVWLSATVMKDADVMRLSKFQAIELLEKNVDIGPAHFMVEDDFLKIKMPIDNRGVTNAVLKADIDYFAEQISGTKDYWYRR